MEHFNNSKSNFRFSLIQLNLFILFLVFTSCSVYNESEINYFAATLSNGQDSIDFSSREPNKFYTPETGHLSIYFETVWLESGLYITIETGAKVGTFNMDGGQSHNAIGRFWGLPTYHANYIYTSQSGSVTITELTKEKAIGTFSFTGVSNDSLFSASATDGEFYVSF